MMVRRVRHAPDLQKGSDPGATELASHGLHTPNPLPMTYQDFVALARQLTVRAFTADFQRERASGRERAQLLTSTSPIASSLGQDYAAWRRAALWVAGVLLSLGVVLALFDYSSTAYQMAAAADGPSAAPLSDRMQQIEQMFGASNLNLLDGLQVFLLLVKVAVAGLAVAAAVRWVKVGSSRTLTRWAWLVALVVPLLISAWPWGQYLDFSHLDNNMFGGAAAGRGAAVQQQVSVAIGATLLITVAPKLLALFPGIMRSSLTLKTLLPQAVAPGWLTVVFAPFLVGFLLLVLCFMSQVQGSWILILGVLSLVAGPCIYLRRARDLVRAHTDAEVGRVVRHIRRQALKFHIVGATLLVLYLFGLESLSWLSAIHLLLEAVGGIMLAMVAISDVTLALLAFSHKQGAAFHGSELEAAHEHRLHELSTSGLTDVEAALGLPMDLERITVLGGVGEPVPRQESTPPAAPSTPVAPDAPVALAASAAMAQAVGAPTVMQTNVRPSPNMLETMIGGLPGQSKPSER